MKVSGFKSEPKALMPSTVNGKRIPLKSTSREMSASEIVKKRSSSIPKKSIKRSRSSMKSKSFPGDGAGDAEVQSPVVIGLKPIHNLKLVTTISLPLPRPKTHQVSRFRSRFFGAAETDQPLFLKIAES